VGDDIFLDTPDGRFQYRVSSLGIVEPNDVSVLDATATPTLTLITCYPFWLAGPAPDRFIVRAAEVARLVTTSVHATVQAEVPGPSPDATTVVLPARASDASARVHSWPGLDNDRDEASVRRAIERFRVAYNSRLARRAGGREAEPLVFGSCDVALRREQATAMCMDALPPSEADGVWVFTLRAADEAWSIASVEPR